MAGRVAPELLAAQQATLAIVRDLEREVRLGRTERELAARAEELAQARGATGFWTPVAVGAGSGNLVCHPDFPPTGRAVAEPDLVWFDVTPDFGGHESKDRHRFDPASKVVASARRSGLSCK